MPWSGEDDNEKQQKIRLLLRYLNAYPVCISFFKDVAYSPPNDDDLAHAFLRDRMLQVVGFCSVEARSGRAGRSTIPIAGSVDDHNVPDPVILEGRDASTVLSVAPVPSS